jgi:hypothetical protein
MKQFSPTLFVIGVLCLCSNALLAQWWMPMLPPLNEQDFMVKFPPNRTVQFPEKPIEERPVVVHSKGNENVQISYKDERFDAPNSTNCYKIVRRWTVINMKYYNPTRNNYLPNGDADVAYDYSYIKDTIIANYFFDALGMALNDNLLYKIDATNTTGFSATANYNHRSLAFTPNTIAGTRKTGFIVDGRAKENCIYLRDYSGDGVIRYVQVLNVGEDVAPTFNYCPKETVTIFSTYAPDGLALVTLPISATDNATPAAALQYNYTVKPFGSTRPSDWIQKNTRNFSEKLPLTKATDKPHQIVWNVVDECGNMRECSYNLRITDKQKPNVACISASTQVGAELNADWLVVMGQDNFTQMSRLKFSFSPDTNDKIRTMTCRDVPMAWVKIYVTDEDGNQNYCETRVRVSDSQRTCNSASNFDMTDPNSTLDQNAELRGNDTFKGLELTNTPNPFSGETTISFQLPEAQSVTIRITDITGSTIKLINGQFEKGYNELKMNDLHISGIVYCYVESAQYRSVRKMVMVK